MRRIGVLGVGLVVGTLIGALGWQMGFAAEPPLDTLVVCERAGADLRSPATNGTCPSGYRRTEISETLSTTNPAYTDSGTAFFSDLSEDTDVTVLAVPVPAGDYVISAVGEFASNDANPQAMSCQIVAGSLSVDTGILSLPDGDVEDNRDRWNTTRAESFDVPTTIEVRCRKDGGAGTAGGAVWELTAERVDEIIESD
jgi:hypothetical protein